ncbi:MAG: hypothetical protein H7X79_09445 [Sporomusaceae bacterium]|nr:hypothetical protein [Sporomusaceae bacterium]
MPETKEAPLINKVNRKRESALTAAPNKGILKIQNQKETTSSKENTKTIGNKDIIPAIQVPAVKPSKPKFKKIHIKDTFWLENDIYQTINTMTNGKKGAKALIINKALKDYLKKNKIAIQKYVEEK